jgi:hypothetical protein
LKKFESPNVRLPLPFFLITPLDLIRVGYWWPPKRNLQHENVSYFSGIQIYEPVAGVAIGLVSKCGDNGLITDHRILTDILVNIS